MKVLFHIFSWEKSYPFLPSYILVIVLFHDFKRTPYAYDRVSWYPYFIDISVQVCFDITMYSILTIGKREVSENRELLSVGVDALLQQRVNKILANNLNALQIHPSPFATT